MIYLAAPYYHPEDKVRTQRFEIVTKIASKLMLSGLKIFSPISHSHPIAEAGGLPLGWDYWASYDREILSTCEKVIVAMLPGWEESKGVKAEIEIARELGLPVEYIFYD